MGLLVGGELVDLLLEDLPFGVIPALVRGKVLLEVKFLGERGVQQHHPGDVLGVGDGVHVGEQSPERRPEQDIGRLDLGRLEQAVQVGHGRLAVQRSRHLVAGAGVGSVVAAEPVPLVGHQRREDPCAGSAGVSWLLAVAVEVDDRRDGNRPPRPSGNGAC